MTDRVHVPLNVAQQHLLASDILSYRLAPFAEDPLGWFVSKPIAIAGRNPDVHTGMLDRQNGDWIALGMRLARQKLKLLADEVARHPGRIDVYRISGYTRPDPTAPWTCGLPAGHRAQIVGEMRRYALRDRYGVTNVIRSGLYFLPVARWAVPHHDEIEDDNARPFCSQAVSHSVRKMIDLPLLNNRPDRLVLPGDIVTSPLLVYLFTLAEPTNFRHPIEAYFEMAGHG